MSGVPDVVGRVRITEKSSTDTYLVIENAAGLTAMVQLAMLEIHPWGSTAAKLETPDRITFDLDPDPGSPWPRVTEAAVGVREALLEIGLKSFAKTTGGKGLHVVVPLTPKLGWDEVKAFAKWVADSLVAQSPGQFTANMAKKARGGRIYLDYLRNSRGATAVGAYSPRARPGAPVSTPLFWEEVEKRRPPQWLCGRDPAEPPGLARIRSAGGDGQAPPACQRRRAAPRRDLIAAHYTPSTFRLSPGRQYASSASTR
jgi:bifunctional non-homologous end joining protein LigD